MIGSNWKYLDGRTSYCEYKATSKFGDATIRPMGWLGFSTLDPQPSDPGDPGT
jgi:hypothetical protein